MRTIMLMMAGWLLCMAAFAQKETRIYQFDKPLYGAAYYAEYTPTNRLDEDIRLMKEAHLTVVRVGESTWSLFEPQDGQFEFAWMDHIIDALHKAGIKVLFSQPLYFIPSQPRDLADFSNVIASCLHTLCCLDVLQPDTVFKRLSHRSVVYLG